MSLAALRAGTTIAIALRASPRGRAFRAATPVRAMVSAVRPVCGLAVLLGGACRRRPARAPRRAPPRAALQASAAAAPPAYLLLKYDYVPDILEKRGPYRAAHLEGANKQVGGGAWAGGWGGARCSLCACAAPPPAFAPLLRPPITHSSPSPSQAQAGKLMVAGALADPVDGAVFIFRGASKEEVESFVAADPYVQNKLVTAWWVGGLGGGGEGREGQGRGGWGGRGARRADCPRPHLPAPPRAGCRSLRPYMVVAGDSK